MRIIFLPGGFLNELGPFEPGAEISAPEAWCADLLANGLALPIPKISSQPVTVTIKLQEAGDV